VRLERLFPNVNYSRISQGNLENQINQLLYSPRVAVFPNVNSVQSLVLPADARTILVKAWGAGGGAGKVGGWLYGADGGGGGYSTAIIDGVSGTLGVVTGQQGYRNQGVGKGFGGGSSASGNGTDNSYGGGGGGYSGVFTSTTINQANALVIAGGGGGGGGYCGGSGGGYSESNTMAGGGGGSGFIRAGAIASSNITGSARTPAGISDVSYPYGLNAGYGGVANTSDGTAGFVVIYY
jgi:hypothetical protein